LNRPFPAVGNLSPMVPVANPTLAAAADGPTVFFEALDPARFHGLGVGTAEYVTRLHEAVTLAQAELLANGSAPLLTEAQALDSPMFVQHPANDSRDALASLIGNGVIRVGLRPQHGSVLAAFASRLRTPGFVFSAWPELDRESPGGPELRALLLDICDTAPVNQDRLVGRIANIDEDCAERADALLQLEAAVRQASRLVTVQEQPRGDALARALRGLWAEAVRAGWSADHPLGVIAESKAPDRSARYRTLDEMEWNRPEVGGACAEARQLLDAAYNAVSGRFVGADQRMIGTAKAGLAQLLADAEGDPVEREQWQTVPVGHTELRSLDWSDVRDFLSSHGETPVADRRRLAEAERLLRLGSGRRRGIAVLPRLHPLVAAGAVLGLESLHPGLGVIGLAGAATSLGWEGVANAAARRAVTAGRSSRGARRELLRSGTIVARGAAL